MRPLKKASAFGAAILVTGVFSGLIGGSVTWLVRAVQHLAYGYDQGPLVAGIIAASSERRILGPTLGCALAGLGWWLLRRTTSIPALDDSIRASRPLPLLPMVGDALLQVLAVGSGASLGREQAPRMLAAVGTELFIRTGSIPVAQRRMLLGGAAGAGLAAVYNVPAAGALFACGIVLRTWRPQAVLVAAATSCIATVTVWPLTHGAATFAWPATDVTSSTVSLAAAVIPVAAVLGGAFIWLTERAKPPITPASWTLIATVGLAGLTTGAASTWLPQLPGNGKSIVLESLDGAGPLVALGLAVVLKPVLTALFLRAGAVGGMITPALSTGAAAGALVALTVNHLGGHASIPVMALAGGAAMLAVTQKAPLFAAVFTAELTHPPALMYGVLVVVAVSTHVVGRLLCRWAR